MRPMWIGLVLGLLVGGLWGGVPGAVVGGFIGWLGGLIVQSRREAKSGTVAMPPESLEARVARLERTVAELQARLAVAAPAAEPTAAASEPLPEPAAAPPLAPEPAAAPRPAPEPAAAAPARPNPIVAWLAGGNTIARVGLLILFFGLAFLARYAVEHQMLPVEARIAIVALGGIALLVIGWRLREKRRDYALGMQGAGVAVLYLTTFGAMRLWHLLPPEAGFVLLALIATFSAILAIAQDAMALAVIGAAGGFLAPVLASTGAGSHVMLFSYYLLLNLGIAGIALFKAWRPLNLTGFLFTFFIGLAWGLQYYRPEHFETTEPFLAAFFVLYVVVAILFARRQAPELRRFVDGTVVFGTPLAAAALQAGLMKGSEMGLAYSSLAAAAFYIVLAWALHRTRRESFALLAQAFMALGVVFVTLAVPLALDARWTSATWALEGAAIVWVGVRQDQRIARLFGIALQALAGGAYLAGLQRTGAEMPILNAVFLGAALVAGAGLWTHRQLLGARDQVSSLEKRLVAPVFVWGLLWWLFAGEREMHLSLPWAQQMSARVAFLAATALVLGIASLRWAWHHAAVATRYLLPVLGLLALATLQDRHWLGQAHAFAHLGWIAWPFALAVHGWTLRRLEPADPPGFWPWLHAGAVWLLALLLAQELHWLAARYTARGTAWTIAAAGAGLALPMLLAASGWARERWPVRANRHAYLGLGATGLALALVAWSLYANLTHDGRSDPLPYLPLLNALDLAHVLAGIAIAAAVLAPAREESAAGEPFASPLRSRHALVVGGAVAFAWLNGVLLRTLHHWADIPYTLHAMERSVLAQASLSVFWSVLALAIMVYATRAARRALWMAGAGLMGIVVLKLFVVDLDNAGGVERIVSFIAVGILMLLIGYFSPVPPRRPEPSA